MDVRFRPAALVPAGRSPILTLLEERAMAWASIRADDATRLSAAASRITLPELAILAWILHP